METVLVYARSKTTFNRNNVNEQHKWSCLSTATTTTKTAAAAAAAAAFITATATTTTTTSLLVSIIVDNDNHDHDNNEVPNVAATSPKPLLRIRNVHISYLGKKAA
jgi:hypothetical protein